MFNVSTLTPFCSSAIELLSLPDSMCRIAAQSTILNVYRVYDKRAREYALQDDMIHKMFAAIVFFMHSQYEKIVTSCVAYVQVYSTAFNYTSHFTNHVQFREPVLEIVNHH